MSQPCILVIGCGSASFGYDAEGGRQTLTTSSGGTTSTTYYTSTPHGPLSQVVARYERSSMDNGGAPMHFDGGGIQWAVYGHGLLYEVAETINTAGKPEENEVLYDHTDQVGSTVAVTNQAGKDVLWVQYDAYGAVTEAVSPTQRDGKPALRPGLNQVADELQRALSVTPYLYCGEHGVMTDRTGLIHMRARYYHPGLRRFVNPDPIGFAGGMNWYGYAGGGPVMQNDPSGLVAYAFPPQYAQSMEFREGFNRGAAAAVPAGLGIGVAVFTGPVVGGAALSAGINATNQILNIHQGTQQSFSGTQMAVHGTVGAAVPAVLNRAVPAAMSLLPNSVKGTLGETFSWINGGLSGRGWAPIAQQTLRIAGRSPRPDFTYPGMGMNGATLYVEAKFGTSTLTSAQRVAANRLGENWITESWTYGWMGSTAAGAGNAVMGLGNTLFGGGNRSSSSGGGCYGRR